LQISAFLIVIALATIASLGPQSHFGRSLMLIIAGPVMAMIGGSGLAV